MRYFNMIDIILYFKYFYVIYMEWKDFFFFLNKKKSKIKRYFIFLFRWKYLLEIEFCILFINVFEYIYLNFCIVFLFKI